MTNLIGYNTVLIMYLIIATALFMDLYLHRRAMLREIKRIYKGGNK